jgi:hypothetical protein
VVGGGGDNILEDARHCSVLYIRKYFVVAPQAVCRRILVGFLYEAAKNFELFSKILDQNLKFENLL